MILYSIVTGVFAFLCFRYHKQIKQNTSLTPQQANIFRLSYQMGKIASCSCILMIISILWKMLLQQTPKILSTGAVLIYSVGLIYTMCKLFAIHKQQN